MNDTVQDDKRKSWIDKCEEMDWKNWIDKIEEQETRTSDKS